MCVHLRAACARTTPAHALQAPYVPRRETAHAFLCTTTAALCLHRAGIISGFPAREIKCQVRAEYTDAWNHLGAELRAFSSPRPTLFCHATLDVAVHTVQEHSSHTQPGIQSRLTTVCSAGKSYSHLDQGAKCTGF